MDRPAPARLVNAAVLLLAALLGTLPLLLQGPSCGHDLAFHLLNWIDAAHQWREGTLRPWWCAAAAWNTGEARFLFYPPLSWTLGGLLTAALGATRAPAAYTLLALAACGFTMRRFLAGYVRAPVALLGACVYLAQPYLLFTATERTAFAELLAAAWLPWMLHEALRERISAPRLALPIALLWLTNTPSSVLATYTLAAVLAVRTVLSLRERLPVLRPVLLPAALGYLWGMALSAFYLLPAVAQHGSVEVAQAFTAGMMPEEGTLFAHTGEPLHDHVVLQASMLAVLLLGVAVLAALVLLAQRHCVQRFHSMRNRMLASTRPHGALLPCLLLLSATVAFLLTPASLPLWHHLPEMLFLQFPWRTLMLQGVLTVALLALTIRARIRYRIAVPSALALVTIVSFLAHHNYAQFCDSEDAPASVQARYGQGGGFEPYDEYTPRDADNDLLHSGEPLAWTAPDATAPAPAEAASPVQDLATGSPATVRLQTEARSTDHFLIVRHRAFRNWHVLLDGAPVRQTADRDDDLIAIPVTGGIHTVVLQYRWSVDQVAGVVVSLLAAAGFALPWRVRHMRRRAA